MDSKDTSKTKSDDVSLDSKMSKFELTVAAATATAQKTAAALMATHVPTNACQNIPNFNSIKDIGMCLKPPTLLNGRSTFVIPKNKLFGSLVPVNQNCPTKISSNPLNKEIEVENKPKRKSKWGLDPRDDPIVKRGLALALQTRAEQIAAQLDSGFLDIETTDIPRSPSPPPIYDSNGQRTNTREGRRREQLEIERREAIGECMKLNPAYKPPAGYKPVYKEAKLFIPVKHYPGYNFIGLILGPRGNTQKRMEQETGTKIAIRGRGALKEGKRPIQSGNCDKDLEGLHDDLHVHITADCIEKVDAAVALIEPLLTPIDEVENMHKRKQLRELAEMNGTIRDFLKICSICGEVGHQNWQCAKEALITFQSKVVCSICGNGGHPSMDCPQKTSKSTSTEGQTLDVEYMNFLKELNNGSLGIVSNATSSSIATNSITSELPSTNTSWSGVQTSCKQPITLSNTLMPQPRLPTSTIMNRPQIIYIRSSTPWRGVNSYNGPQLPSIPTKLIRIAGGNCIQQPPPLCISSTTNGQHGVSSESDSKSNATNDNTTQQLEKTVAVFQSPLSTIGTNQSGPRLSQNPIRMVTSSNSIGIHPQQMIRPMYPTTVHSNIPSQPIRCQQIRIIHRPPNGIINPINVVRTQVILANQTNLQRMASTQPLQGPFRPNSLQTQSQICAWPQPMAPTCPSQAPQSSQPSSTPSNSHVLSQSWQTLPMNATNCIQSQHINQCLQPIPPPPPPTFQSNTNVIDLQSKNSVGLVSQLPSLSSVLNIQNQISIRNSTNNEVEKSQEAQLQTLLKLPSSFGNTQSIDVEYEKLMALVGIT